ncbi:MAG: minor capsid protein [Oscillospiraceae bacterium]|nr:minor capsid protein [Oscillospiraceae bacterium]
MPSKFDVNINWSAALKEKSNFIRPYGQLQKFIDSSVLQGVADYIPFRAGIAVKSGILYTVIGSGAIVWKTPYIRYIYFGISKRGNPLQYDTTKHRKAGAFWAERYKADNMTALEASVKRKLGQLWN